MIFATIIKNGSRYLSAVSSLLAIDRLFLSLFLLEIRFDFVQAEQSSFVFQCCRADLDGRDRCVRLQHQSVARRFFRSGNVHQSIKRKIRRDSIALFCSREMKSSRRTSLFLDETKVNERHCLSRDSFCFSRRSVAKEEKPAVENQRRRKSHNQKIRDAHLQRTEEKQAEKQVHFSSTPCSCWSVLLFSRRKKNISKRWKQRWNDTRATNSPGWKNWRRKLGEVNRWWKDKSICSWRKFRNRNNKNKSFASFLAKARRWTWKRISLLPRLPSGETTLPFEIDQLSESICSSALNLALL